MVAIAPETKPVVRPLVLDPNEISFYKQQGYLYLPGLVGRELARGLYDEVLDVMSRIGVPLERLQRAGEVGDKLRQTSKYLQGGLLDGLVNSENLRSIAGQLMGGPSSVYLPFTAVKNGGGGGRFHFHQDNQYTRFTDGLLGINIWFALSEMTPENGCLQMCPKSHLRGTLEAVQSSDGDTHKMNKVEPDDFLPLRMMPGDAVAFSRLTLHGSGANLTNEPRAAYAVQFFRDDAEAVWDNQPARPLKNANRWPVGPVREIVPPSAEVNYDGH